MRAHAALLLLLAALALPCCAQNDIWDALTRKPEGTIDDRVITRWEFIDGSPTTASGLNIDPARNAQDVQLGVYNNRLYATWTEQNAVAFQIRVAVYNGDKTWSFVDGGGINGLNNNSAISAWWPRIASIGPTLYIIWREPNGAIDQIRVRSFNGAIWSWEDGGGANGINWDIAQDAQDPAALSIGGAVLVSWHEYNGTAVQTRVRHYDGLAWTWLEHPLPADEFGINRVAANYTSGGHLCFYSLSPHALWHENSGIMQIRAAVFTGTIGVPSWSFIDGGDNVNGLNANTSRSAIFPQCAEFNSKLYAIWEEVNGSAISQIRLAVYNGSGWQQLLSDPECGINRDCSQSARRPSVGVFGGRLYCTWYESNGTANQIRVVAYNGNDASPSFEPVEGSSNPLNGINYNPAQGGVYPQLLSHGGELYATWYEALRIRVAVGKTN